MVRALPLKTWSFRTQGRVLGGVVILFWAVYVAELLLPSRYSLLQFGIHPRDFRSLLGILFAPFLHDGIGHVLANSLGFVVLGWLVMMRSSHHFLLVSAVSALISGLGAWVFGAAGTVHVGASGVIFGYVGFLLMMGYFERSWKSFLIAILVAIVFGAMIWGILPLSAGVSWQSHLFGFLAGGLTARWIAYRSARSR